MQIISLVRLLAVGYDPTTKLSVASAASSVANPELNTLLVQAWELLLPLPDFEATARKAGWKTADMTPGMLVRGVPGRPQADEAMSWRMACALDNLTPDTVPVEHVRIVSKDIAMHLKVLGERVDSDFGGVCVWATAAGTDVSHVLSIVTKLAFHEQAHAANWGSGQGRADSGVHL